MANVNKIILVGTVTEKPNVRFGMENSQSIANFSVAVERPTRNDGTHEEDIVPVVAFGKSADYVAEYVQRGTVAIIEGRIQVRTVESSGQREWITEVAASQVKTILTTMSGVEENKVKPMKKIIEDITDAQPALVQNPFENAGITEDDVPF